jgi:hypothetical protein
MLKDYGPAIRSGFESTGICPLSVDTALSKLPKEDREVATKVQQQLLNKLSELRYNPAVPTRAPRPKKSDKLPAGASYTCSVTTPTVRRKHVAAAQVRPSGDDTDSDNSDVPEAESSDDSEDTDSDESDTERSRQVCNIIQRLASKKRYRQEDDEDADDILDQAMDSDKDKEQEQEPDMEQVKENQQEEYLPGSYVAVMYEGNWFVGEVLDKGGEPEAEEGDNYVFINFMQHGQQGSQGERLVWPRKVDRLNVLKEDILLACQAPLPNPSVSTIRGVTYSLTKAEIEKTKKLFSRFKAYYPTSMRNIEFVSRKRKKSHILIHLTSWILTWKSFLNFSLCLKRGYGSALH